MDTSLVFGPVPSRRLGRSLGVNNIPPKICTYSCVYCQLGRTLDMRIERSSYYDPDEIISTVRSAVGRCRETDQKIDYITFVPDGEPTLDENLGRELEGVKDPGYKTAVISNGSLIWRDDVREDLMVSDLVSLKMDSALGSVWKKVDRPHGSLDLDEIKQGMLKFSDKFRGSLITETMLIEGVNDGEESLIETADFLSEASPGKAYISIPTRPPAENWVRAAPESNLTEAFRIFKERGLDPELIIGYEGNRFSSTGDPREDLLSITAVHPMRDDAVEELLSRSGKSWDVVSKLIDEELIKRLDFGEHSYYLRKLNRR